LFIFAVGNMLCIPQKISVISPPINMALNRAFALEGASPKNILGKSVRFSEMNRLSIYVIYFIYRAKSLRLRLRDFLYNI